MANRISDSGLQLIAGFEGLSLLLYNDPVGHCTIGYGHLVHRGPINGSEPAEFRRGITEARALELLRADAASAESAVNGAVQVPLNQHQFDALVSFVYNVGAGALQTSTLLRLLNSGDYDAVPAQLARWTKASGVELPGLVRRRQAEGQLWSQSAPAPRRRPPNNNRQRDLELAGGEGAMAVIVKAPGSDTNYVTNFVVRRPIRTAKERQEMVRAGLPPTVHQISEETLKSIPVLENE
ncbi:MAG: lysozyme [Dehalococcoidia bacterium]